MHFHVLRAALAGGDYLILLQELVGGLLERLADLKHARPAFAHESQIPVLGEVFRMGKAFFLRGDTPVLSGHVG